MIQEFFATPLGLVVYAMLVATAADFTFGVWAAIRSGTFTLSVIAAVLRKHIQGRVAPIFGMLFFGHFGNQPALLALGMAAGGAYAVETIASIMESFSPGTKDIPVD